MSEKDASSIIADFQFVSYKVDEIKFKVTQTLRVLQCKDMVDQEQINLQLAIKQPSRYIRENQPTIYIGGLKIKVKLVDKDDKRKTIASGEFGISGLFKKHHEIPADQEEYMVKTTIPAILLSYLRASITTTIANAGFGSTILPLINISNLVSKMNIQILDK